MIWLFKWLVGALSKPLTKYCQFYLGALHAFFAAWELSPPDLLLRCGVNRQEPGLIVMNSIDIDDVAFKRACGSSL